MEEVDKGRVKVYSHSKLWLYENCPEYYKLKYVDKKLPELPRKMPPFLGNMVHESLEWLYYQVKNRKIEIDDLIEDFSERWSKNYTEDIVIEKGSPKDGFNMGVKFLVDYYMKHFPFNQNVVAIERKVLFPLDENKEYLIQGYIDRLDYNEKDGFYEVHDYKTGAGLKSQKQLDEDKQLALYHIGLKEALGENINVKLVWHFLAHNLNISSRRTNEQLKELKENTLGLIKGIESNEDWPSCGKKWCDWCTYKKKHDVEYEDAVKVEEVKKDERKKVMFSKGQMTLFS